MQDHVAAQLAAVPHHGARVQRTAGADDRAVADVGERVDGDVGTDLGGGGDPGEWVDAGPAGGCGAAEVVADGEEGGQGVVDLDDRQRGGGGLGLEVGADDGGRRRRGAEPLGVPLVVDEGDVPRPGLGDRPRGEDRHAAVADESAPDERSQLFHGGDHVGVPFFPERSEVNGDRAPAPPNAGAASAGLGPA